MFPKQISRGTAPSNWSAAYVLVRLLRRTVAWLAASLLVPAAAVAGGPKFVAGTSFFNPGVVGQPFTGPTATKLLRRSGPAHASVTNQQARAMVECGGGALECNSHCRRNPLPTRVR